jgi:FkbM family methyltransferase
LYDQLIKEGVKFTKQGSDTKIDGFNVNGENISLLMRRNTSDIDVFQQILIEEEFKPLLVLLRKLDLLNHSLNVVDAGGNVGFVSIYLSAFLRISNLIVIEPASDNINYLNLNLEINGISNYKIVQGGIHYEDDKLSLNTSFRDGNFWSINLVKGQHDRNIPVYSIDTIRKNFNLDIIDILKIDIEGSEKGIFEHKNLDWLDIVKVITIEVHEEFISKEFVKKRLTDKLFEVFEQGELLIGYNTRLVC